MTIITLCTFCSINSFDHGFDSDIEILLEESDINNFIGKRIRTSIMQKPEVVKAYLRFGIN